MIHINEVSNLTNTTARTLRYYDQIGLLASSAKTQGGHRLYTEEDLQKLQQIQFYKSMGYRISDIKEMLTQPDWNWNAGLVKQLTYILDEQARLREMEQTIRTLLSGITVEEGNQEGAIQKLIKLTMQDKKRREHYKKAIFSDVELESWRNLPNMNGGNPESMEWIGLIGLLTKYHTCKEPSSPCVQNVIRRMLEKQKEEFENEDEFINKLWEVRKCPDSSEQLGLYPIQPEVLEYMERAYEIFISSDGERDTQLGEGT
ncbi:MerR family transcriptional regulator [Paenibacillus sp. SC116]|uniref:MerR family transcriptional regulator n=1 Tax=Paenibacillus sp. SC116 TaxID=2968986 RepID=UPI00215B262A|nr:MerR family transcriptional regulator [Paenibacillus sp. SC116]MCR8842615.1 MerR family transcriptional regulator [Paenibacillus sp. SC116]